MDHHIVLILAKMLNRIALTRVVIKGQNYELLEKFIFKYVPGEERIGCISSDDPESVKMWHTCSFYLLLYKLVEILNANELDFPQNEQVYPLRKDEESLTCRGIA